MGHTPGIYPQCGCKVVGASHPFEINYCDKHAAAPEFLEALNGLVDLLEFEKHAPRPQIEKAKQLIAKAEGQPSV